MRFIQGFKTHYIMGGVGGGCLFAPIEIENKYFSTLVQVTNTDQWQQQCCGPLFHTS
jgi:hypothetical protein